MVVDRVVSHNPEMCLTTFKLVLTVRRTVWGSDTESSESSSLRHMIKDYYDGEEFLRNSSRHRQSSTEKSSRQHTRVYSYLVG